MDVFVGVLWSVASWSAYWSAWTSACWSGSVVVVTVGVLGGVPSRRRRVTVGVDVGVEVGVIVGVLVGVTEGPIRVTMIEPLLPTTGLRFMPFGSCGDLIGCWRDVDVPDDVPP